MAKRIVSPTKPEPKKEVVWITQPDRPIWVVVALHRTADTFHEGTYEVVGGYNSPSLAESYAKGRVCGEWSLVYTVVDKGAGDLLPLAVYEYLKGKRLPTDDEIQMLSAPGLTNHIERVAIATRAYLDTCGAA